MQTIWGDFNAQTEDGHIRLTTLGSQASLQVAEVAPGDQVWLSDGQLRVVACVEEVGGRLLALPAWDTVENVIEPGDDEEPRP